MKIALAIINKQNTIKTSVDNKPNKTLPRPNTPVNLNKMPRVNNFPNINNFPKGNKTPGSIIRLPKKDDK